MVSPESRILGVGTVGIYLYPIYPPFPVLIFYLKYGGGVAFYTILNILRKPGGGGCQNKQNVVVFGSESVGGRSRATEWPCLCALLLCAGSSVMQGVKLIWMQVC